MKLSLAAYYAKKKVGFNLENSETIQTDMSSIAELKALMMEQLNIINGDQMMLSEKLEQ